jgi:hypothetical protein
VRARQYDPQGGRFVQTDPVGLDVTDATESRYPYARNRPTVLRDPTGLIATGGCISVKVSLFKFIGGSVCVVGTDEFQYGITASRATGTGTGIGAAIGVGGFVSDADYVEDLAGPFDVLGASLGGTQVGFSGEEQWGLGRCDNPVGVGASAFGRAIGGTLSSLGALCRGFSSRGSELSLGRFSSH